MKRLKEFCVKEVGLFGFEPKSNAPKAPRIANLPYNPRKVVTTGFEPVSEPRKGFMIVRYTM